MKPSSMRTTGPSKASAAARICGVSLPAHQISLPPVARAWATAAEERQK